MASPRWLSGGDGEDVGSEEAREILWSNRVSSPGIIQVSFQAPAWGGGTGGHAPLPALDPGLEVGRREGETLVGPREGPKFCSSDQSRCTEQTMVLRLARWGAPV